MFHPIHQKIERSVDSFVALAGSHHLRWEQTLGQIEQQLEQFLESNQFLSAEQVQKRSILSSH